VLNLDGNGFGGIAYEKEMMRYFLKKEMIDMIALIDAQFMLGRS
jgi:hypothetical protein